MGWVNVGVTADTAEFAVNSIRYWWKMIGKKKYPKKDKLLICADAGGSNGYRSRLWKVASSLNTMTNYIVGTGRDLSARFIFLRTGHDLFLRTGHDLSLQFEN